MPDKIVILGASDLQLPLIRKAKALGFETHVFAWAADDVGEKEADHFYPVSVTEVDRITEICRALRPVAVASIASDLTAIAATKIAAALNLPGNPVETTVLAANKYAMRAAFAEAGLPVPQYVKIRKPETVSAQKDNVHETIPGEGIVRGTAERDLCSGFACGTADRELFSSFHFPVIVKPTDRSGSRGIFKVSAPGQVAPCVALAQQESFEHAAIVEEYIEGKEYSVECVSEDGHHRRLAITEKYTTGAPHFIETGHIEPAGLSPETETRIDEVVFRALDALHIRCGASHTELKITPEGELRLIEVGARMGGDCIGSDLVPLTTGFDFLKMVLDAALGNPLDKTPTLKSVSADSGILQCEIATPTPAPDDSGSLRNAAPLPVPAAAVRYIMEEADFVHYQTLKQQHPEAIVREHVHFEAARQDAVTDSSTRYGFYIVRGRSREEVRTLAGLS